jgi:hypothetical protein
VVRLYLTCAAAGLRSVSAPSVINDAAISRSSFRIPLQVRTVGFCWAFYKAIVKES